MFLINVCYTNTNFRSIARLSGCIQQQEWLALNIVDWSTNTRPLSAPGRNAELL
jgi:hypothetical protein